MTFIDLSILYNVQPNLGGGGPAAMTDHGNKPAHSRSAEQQHAAPARPVRAVLAASAAILQAERAAIMGFMYLLAALILLNVVTRYSGHPLYWVDESAVYSVVWLTFIGASAMTRLRLDFAVTLLTERLPERVVATAKICAGCGVVLFGILLAWMCWLWLDPIGIARAGFDAKAYAAKSFNFIYTERTQTLNWPTWILYLIIPLFSVTLTIHALANVFEDLQRAPRVSHPGFSFGQTDGIN
jgi:TRAP-type C4-dicarboxylate transport system permease small subunit